jgi:hypothetical protein
MNGFRLHAVGEFFDVDRYLSQYSIDYNSIWHSGKNLYTSSGFVKYLGNEPSISYDYEYEVERMQGGWQ